MVLEIAFRGVSVRIPLRFISQFIGAVSNVTKIFASLIGRDLWLLPKHFTEHLEVLPHSLDKIA
jgi:hypothetical protein